MLHIVYICLIHFKNIFLVSVTYVQARSSLQLVASKNYSLCSINAQLNWFIRSQRNVAYSGIDKFSSSDAYLSCRRLFVICLKLWVPFFIFVLLWAILHMSGLFYDIWQHMDRCIMKD